MSQQQQQVQYQQQPVLQRQIQQRQPRYGGGGGGGNERSGGPKDYDPDEVSQIFRLLQEISDKYFYKESPQPIPEEAIRELHHEVFGAIAESTGDKNKLLALLRSISADADEERLSRDSRLSAEQMGDAIRRTITRIRDCFFPEV